MSALYDKNLFDRTKSDTLKVERLEGTDIDPLRLERLW